MATEEQIAANRINAQKSRGPASPEGKRRSSLNALKHGALSKALLIDGECPKAFAKLFNTYIRDYNPETQTEVDLVRSMVIARWRQARIMNFESLTINTAIRNQPVTDPDACQQDAPTRASIAFNALCDVNRAMSVLPSYESRFERQYRTALRQLRELRKNVVFDIRNEWNHSFKKT